jgi:mannosyltransferase
VSAVAAAPARAAAPDPGSADSGPSRPIVAALVVVVAVGIVFRFVARSDLWLDEALTVNIAKLPLSDLRDALRHDGAPPLFYVLLHGWIKIFGSSDVAVRALAGVISVATLPAAWIAGKRLAGRWGAWAAVAVLASSPYAIRYATETRMYSLAMFLVLWGYVVLRRALDRGSLLWYALVAVITGALCYTVYWSFYLLAVVGIGLVWRAWRAPDLADRQAARGVIVGMIAGGLMFVPWLSTFRDQLQHTGTPWGSARLPWFGVAEAFAQFAGGDKHAEAFVYLPVLIVLPLLALFGAAVDRTHIDLDLRTRPAVRWETATAFATLVLGLVVSYIGSTAFEGRYAAVMFPILALVIAYSVMTFASIRVRAGVLAFIVLLGFAGGVRNATENRTQAAQVADVINAEAKPGDYVVYCPDQVGPSVHRLLSPGLHLVELTYPSGAPPLLIDWVDYVDRINATDPAAFARRVLRRADGHTIWYVAAFGYHNVEGKCEGLGNAFDASRKGTERVVGNADKYFEYQGLFEYPPS